MTKPTTLVSKLQALISDDITNSIKTKKASTMRSFSNISFETGLFFPVIHVFLVSCIEFINTTCSVNQFHFSSVEWVRRT